MEPQVAQTEETDESVTEIPEDFAEFQKYRDGQEDPDNAPTAGEETTPPSAPADKAGQIALDSEAEEEDEQAEDEPQDTKKPKDPRLSRRMRKMAGEIGFLKARLAEFTQPHDADDEGTGEVASPPEVEEAAEVEAEAETKLTRPMLRDFEDTEDQSAWDQYEAAMDEYNSKKTQLLLDQKLSEQRQQLDAEHAKATAQADWNKAASRFPDFNEVVRDEVKISAAMETVMRMDPESGTALAYYMGQHPEESLRIAQATLATDKSQWATALARAGMELGLIRAKLATPPGKPATRTASGPPAKPPIKTVTTASKPPVQLRGGAATPAFDVLNDEDARDTGKWLKAREAQLARSGKR